MKRTALAITLGLSVLTMVGCSNKVSYGDATEVETVDVGFGSTDLQTVAQQMTDDLLTFPAVVAITAKERPVVYVERIKNKTSEHIDTESITDSISTKLLRSGKFRFVDMARVDSVRQQLEFQNSGGMVDPATAVSFGKQIGAQYMLYGNLSSIVKDNGKQKDVYYKFTMRLMDLQTGILEWADETEIRKVEERSKFGL
ncbi:penicillin-binding protein activator LpoB [Motilimonas pumila]|uniref:Penicillin-binding protein activator LpoB n=1 Tax=Motilimonas pumila TaxID=2303987 RepID=A0A418YBW4_9GAMM|nr:penicillin-binding protein activator LpoB [Motilimonas pumila]RJG41987.1 penicillin-binding protein activator LpoB [Motilimonas pumila]